MTDNSDLDLDTPIRQGGRGSGGEASTGGTPGGIGTDAGGPEDDAMSNEELDATAASADPDDLGSSDTGSGLTAGGTGTALGGGDDSRGGTPLSGGSVTGGTSSGEIGTTGSGIPPKPAIEDP